MTNNSVISHYWGSCFKEGHHAIVRLFFLPCRISHRISEKGHFSVRILTLQHIVFKILMMFSLESSVKHAVKFTVACNAKKQTHIGSWKSGCICGRAREQAFYGVCPWAMATRGHGGPRRGKETQTIMQQCLSSKRLLLVLVLYHTWCIGEQRKREGSLAWSFFSLISHVTATARSWWGATGSSRHVHAMAHGSVWFTAGVLGHTMEVGEEWGLRTSRGVKAACHPLGNSIIWRWTQGKVWAPNHAISSLSKDCGCRYR
jgi:hypothetical protein